MSGVCSIKIVGEFADFGFGGIVAIEIATDEQHAAHQQRGVDGR
jgi:hypothetical protein